MFPSTASSNKNESNDAKARIYALVNTLTDLNPNMLEIIKPIEESNALLKEVTEEIDQLNTKSLLIKLAHLAVLEQRLPDLKTKIDSYILQLQNAKNETTNLCVDYGNVIESLKNSALEIDENDALKTDALGIVSVNNLKLKNIQNQIQSASSQIENLERFRTVTLYHLSDTINNTKTDKELPIVEEIRRVIDKLKSRKDYSLKSAVLFTILVVYNFLADKYHITYDSTQRIAQKAASSSFANTHGVGSPMVAAEGIGNILDIFSKVGTVLGVVIVGFGLFRFAVQREGVGTLALGTMMGMTSVLIPSIIKPVLGLEETETTYVEQTVKVTYDFFNSGTSGTIVYLGFLILCVLYAYFKQKEIKKYSTVVNKLEKSPKLNIDQKASELVSNEA